MGYDWSPDTASLFTPTEIKSSALEALGEHRPPWQRQIVTPILSTVKVLSLGGERLAPKILDNYLHHDLVMLQLIYSFAHLLMLEDLAYHQKLISSSWYYPGTPSPPKKTPTPPPPKKKKKKNRTKQTNKNPNPFITF